LSVFLGPGPLICRAGNTSDAGSRTIDSLVRFIRTAGADTSKVNALNSLSQHLVRSGRYDTAIAVSRQAQALAASLPVSTGGFGLANAHNGMGLIYYETGNYPEALVQFLKAIKVIESLLAEHSAKAETNRAKKIRANAHNNIGLIYQDQGDYPGALNEFLAALKIREEIGDLRGAASARNNIGIIYKNQGNYTEALREYEATLKIAEVLLSGAKSQAEKTKTNKIIGNVHNNIGGIYYLQGDYTRALEKFLVALRIREESGDKKYIADSHNNIGLVYQDEGRNEDAVRQYLASLRIYEESGDPQGIAAANINLGSVHLELKKISLAYEYLNRSLSVSKSIGYKDGLKESYLGLSRADSAAGNWKRSFRHYTMYIIYRDSLSNEENTRRSIQAQMNYQFGKQQAADSIRNAEEVKQEQLRHGQEIQQQRLYTYGGGLGFLLMLVVAGVSFRAYRQKQKANEIITAQKHLVEEKQKEILDSIHYAKRIQQSSLTSERYIEKQLKRLPKR
jgi:tetratricopeptide (TPR) repeat protein